MREKEQTVAALNTALAELSEAEQEKRRVRLREVARSLTDRKPLEPLELAAHLARIEDTPESTGSF